MNHQHENLVLIELGDEVATCERAYDDGAIQASEDGTARPDVEVTEVSADADADMAMEFATETDEVSYWRESYKTMAHTCEAQLRNAEDDERYIDELAKELDEQAQYIQQLVKDHDAQGQKFAAAEGSLRRNLAQKAIESATRAVHFEEARKAVQYGLSLLQKKVEVDGNESLI
jgi:hypothetical protein